MTAVLSESDWTLVIKLHSLVEAAVTGNRTRRSRFVKKGAEKIVEE